MSLVELKEAVKSMDTNPTQVSDHFESLVRASSRASYVSPIPCPTEIYMAVSFKRAHRASTSTIVNLTL